MARQPRRTKSGIQGKNGGGCVDIVEDRVELARECAVARQELRRLRHAVEERRPKSSIQIRHLVIDARLCDAERGGIGAEAAGPGQSLGGAQGIQRRLRHGIGPLRNLIDPF